MWEVIDYLMILNLCSSWIARILHKPYNFVTLIFSLVTRINQFLVSHTRSYSQRVRVWAETVGKQVLIAYAITLLDHRCSLFPQFKNVTNKCGNLRKIQLSLQKFVQIPQTLTHRHLLKAISPEWNRVWLARLYLFIICFYCAEINIDYSAQILLLKLL